MTGALGFGDLKNAHHALDEQSGVLQRVRKDLQRDDSRKGEGRLGRLMRSKTGNGDGSNLRQRRTLLVDVKEGEQATPSSVSPRDDENALQTSSPAHDTEAEDQLVRNEETHLVEKVTDSFPPTQVEPPASTSKAMATPSMISISNFKRRPRQPSILRMVQQRLEHEGEDDEGDLDLELDGESHLLGPLESSSPTAVRVPSTPQANTSSSRKRKLQNEERTRSSPLSSPPESPISHSKRSRLSSKVKMFLTGSPPVDNQSAGTGSSSGSSKPNLPRPADARRMSSSPSASLPKHITRPQRTSQRHSTSTREKSLPIPTVEAATSPISTPPSSSVTASPVKQPPKPRHDPKALSTASLQAFLPRRRRLQRNARAPRTAANTFEVLSSSDVSSSSVEDNNDVDADHLGRPSRLRKHVKKLVKKRTPAKKKLAKGKEPPGSTINIGGERGGVGGAPAKPANSSKTYGRRLSAAADKENPGRPASDDDEGDGTGDDGDGNASSSRLPDRTPKASSKSRELAEAARKFAEVDEWELDFESQDVGHDGRGSSPWR